jgi:DNA-directed RNA polymerase subunit RPC12/RpoP
MVGAMVGIVIIAFLTMSKDRKMKKVCAWCGKIIKEDEGEATDAVCPVCLEKALKELNIVKTKESDGLDDIHDNVGAK